MTDQTKRALERLPKQPFHMVDFSHNLAVSELAEHSPALLEMLDDLAHAETPNAIYAFQGRAQILLRETTRAMLGQKIS